MAENRFRFTKTALAGIVCPPDKSKVRVFDTEVQGLSFLVRREGWRGYYLYRKVNGRPMEVKIGSEAEIASPELARRRAFELNGQIVAGMNPMHEKRKAREAATLGDMWDAYRREVIKGLRTMTEDAGLWSRYLEPWAKRRVSDVTVEAVQTLYAKIAGGNMNREAEDSKGRKRPIKGGTTAANRTMALLSGMFSACGRKFGAAGFNPCSEVRKAKESACDRYLSREELPAFWQALSGQSELIQDLVKLSLFTGQRRWTLFTMEWAEVNLTFNTWTIPAAKMKSGKAHTVPLIPQAVEILKRRKEAAGKGAVYVLASPESRSGHVEEPKKALNAIAKAAGIAPVTLHDLRRTCATWMNTTGTSESIIAALLAHAYRNVTGIYAQATMDAMRKALARAVEAMMDAAAVAKPADAAGKSVQGEQAGAA